MIRSIGLVLLLMGGLVAPAEAANPPHAETAFQGYFADPFDPGDFGWLAWRSSDDPSDREKWRQLNAWAERVKELRTAEEKSKLAAIGETSDKLPLGCYGEVVCNWVTDSTATEDAVGGWSKFSATLDSIRPYYSGYEIGFSTARGFIVPGPGESVSDQLNEILFLDQLARPFDRLYAMNLSPDQKRVLGLLITHQLMQRVDNDNLELFEKLFAKIGWPAAGLGHKPSLGSFLIVQHSDAHPAFQIQVMRALAKQDKDSGGRYLPLLADRVQLKLHGTQTYGSQFHCVEGHMEPYPVTDPAGLDARRASVGLDPIDVYRKTFPAHC